MNWFQHRSIVACLHAWIEGGGERAPKLRLSEAAQCTPSWITRVLLEEARLTPDQAHGIAVFCGLNDGETEYFLTLLDWERAGTPALRRRLADRLERLRRDGKHVGASVSRTAEKLSDEQLARYYSSWIYPAIHVAAMIRAQTIPEIGRRLKLDARTVTRACAVLEEIGLVDSHGGKVAATQKNVHVPAGSALANLGHVQWRLRAVEHLQTLNTTGLHYSAFHFLSAADARKVETLLKNAILGARAVIDPSDGEEMIAFNLDFFAVDTREGGG